MALTQFGLRARLNEAVRDENTPLAGRERVPLAVWHEASVG